MSDLVTMFNNWLHPAAPASVDASSSPMPQAVAPTPIAACDMISPAAIPGLARALVAAAPHADLSVWVPALSPALTKADCTTPRRISALLGQCAVEAGSGFGELAENTNYTSPARLLAIFPREFTPAQAAADAGHAQLIANQAYANRLGNGAAATNDGWNFRGHGLIQVTGRTEFTAFAAWCGRSVEDAAAWALTPPGAAMTAAWYWSANGLNALADAWNLEAITRKVNGAAELGLSQRVAAANAALATFS
jgi:putative chitinase